MLEYSNCVTENSMLKLGRSVFRTGKKSIYGVTDLQSPLLTERLAENFLVVSLYMLVDVLAFDPSLSAKFMILIQIIRLMG